MDCVRVCAMISFSRKRMCQFITNLGLETSRLSRWEGNLQFNQMVRFRVAIVKDVTWVWQRRLTTLWTTRSTFRIPRGYTIIIADPILNIDIGPHELHWAYVGNKRLTMISTNDVYYKLIDKHKWMEERVIKVLSFRMPIT